jgi:hypothetical protein
MTWLYLAQVGDDWFSEFQRTAARSIEIEGKNVPRQLRDYENVRIWGTTDSERKRTHFDQMETGDLVFFHRNEVFLPPHESARGSLAQRLGNGYGIIQGVDLSTLLANTQKWISPSKSCGMC